MKKIKLSHDDHITKILSNPTKVTEIIQKGINDALLKHKQAGNPICEWRDNKIVWIPADKIVINNE
ncbi:MAG: hypothetical protein ACO1N3_02390 [Gammaproteobacteria bacterium]